MENTPTPASSIPAPTPDDARAALDAVSSSRASVAAQMRRRPPWYHVVYGLGCALLVGSVGLQHQGLQIAGLILAALVFGVLIGAYRASTGIALGASWRPRGPVVLLACVLGLAAVASWLDGRHGLVWGVAVLAVATGVAGWALSRRYEQEQIALLEDAAGPVAGPAAGGPVDGPADSGEDEGEDA